MKKNISMVDITNKQQTLRKAVAKGRIYFSKKVYELIKNNEIPKGDVLSVAQVAGVLAAKNVSHIIPLTHPINITYCRVTPSLGVANKKYYCDVITEVQVEGKTGPDIEALFACVVSLVTIYDMIKQFCPEAKIDDVKLISKSGGKTNFLRK
ncbi:MAG: cyclic pyranopterin monophosphate synthase MoaC [Endomicrobia bacterium]|nr:cyclic pyranopterin monophosphate synthase MoaC [Endomicrobiia bacterium]MDW8055682.1 cyclic pyranopterin monophosphate synthase MoaC [Elusimicrobiota bacterium]